MNKIKQYIEERDNRYKTSSYLDQTILLNWLRVWTKLYDKDKESDFARILGKLIQNEQEETIKGLIDVIVDEIEKTANSIDSLPDMIHPVTHDDWVKTWYMSLKRINNFKTKLKKVIK